MLLPQYAAQPSVPRGQAHRGMNPAPKVALGRLVAIDFHVEAALVKGSELALLSRTVPLSVPLVAGETVRSAMTGPRTPGREPINRCAPVGTASNPLNDPFSVSSLPASLAVTEPPPERSARVPTRRGPGRQTEWIVVGGRRSAQQGAEKARPEQPICALRCAPDSAQARENLCRSP